ncbi:MAG: AAA family ATPase, partial [Clostridia bacterium]|nr:AAA family ATPase [Clostridia bacterium]
MIIKEIHIDSFGSLKNRDFELGEGLNILEGANESGKSTVAMFIKFMLYGLSGRRADGEIPDKNRYASWDTGTASGYMTVSVDGKDYRIEREYFAYSDALSSGDASKDRCTVTELSTGERVFKNEVPGMALLGMPEQLFVNTVFVKQLSDGKIDGVGMAEAVENLLMSGDEGV